MNAEEMIESVLSGMEGRACWSKPFTETRTNVIRFEKLRVALDRLWTTGRAFEHPPDLASRTVSFVARNRRRPLTLLEQVSTRLPFRWADFAVAASIFVAGVLTLAAGHPALARANEPGWLRLQSSAAWQQPGAVCDLAGIAAVSPFASVRHACRNVRGDAARCGRAERHVGARLSLQRAVPAGEAGACRLRPGGPHPANRSRAVSRDALLGLCI